MTRHVIIGLGSIGQKHWHTLRSLGVSGNDIRTVDPSNERGGNANYTRIVSDLIPGTAVYICSPTDTHESILEEVLVQSPAAVFVEKPMFSKLSGYGFEVDTPVACGYCYRYHREFQSLTALPLRYLHWAGVDNLVSRYGNNTLEVMLSHCIDMAMFQMGDCHWSSIADAGAWAGGVLSLERGEANIYSNLAMPHRHATGYAITWDGEYRLLNLNDSKSIDVMYIDQMKAWLKFLSTGDKGDLCFYEDAMRVQRVMSEATSG